MPEGTIECPLSPSVPRDCGHECKVCRVTVTSLTDYASHISSPLHKQNVEAEELKNSGKNHDKFYFDKELVDLIERRKERIRKEEEAAAAKKAKEEEELRKQQEFQQKLKEAKERFRLDCTWQQTAHGFIGSNRQGTWYGKNKYGARSGQDAMDSRPWQQGKSATWHAQEPPNFQRWGSGDLGGGNFHSQEGWGNTQWDQGAFYGNQGGRHPWLSNGGSSHGIYGRNNISQYPKRGKSTGFFGSFPRHPPPPSFSGHAADQFKNKSSGQWSNGGQQGNGHQNGQGQNAEYDHNSSNSFGSNQKLDKSCRWSPYPVTKVSDSAPQDTHPSSTEKNSKVPATLKQQKVSDSNRQSRPKLKKGSVTSNGQKFEAVKRPSTSKNRERSSSGGRSNTARSQGDGLHNSSAGTSSQNPNKPLLHKHKKLSSADLNVRAQLKKASSQEHEPSKSTSKPSSPIGPLQSRQEQQFPEILRKAKEMLLDKRSSLDRSSNNNRVETTLHIMEETQVGVNKENSCRQNAVKSALSESIRPLYGEEKAKPALPSLDSSQFLQSVHVSTSTMEKSEPAVSAGKDQEDKKREEKESCSPAPDEAMQVAEAGQGSESDASRSGEAQTTSGSNTSSLSKLDLPSVLKRDLTKHISSKSKPGSHEPNLNSARRVRNLNETRRSETEKESGIKPTVRQLISSSGSRRNVNWEQVYQEVRKKQEQGKGMPRFGIEMVPCDQEEQSQEDDDVPLLEGFHWESVADIADSGTSRKRSLSESSLAPDRSATAHSLFPSHISKDTADRIGFSPPGILNSEQQRSSFSPTSTPTHGTRDNQHQVKVEQMLGECEVIAQKQPDKTSETVEGLQRSDSVLGESSSGTELYDGPGTGKKRRAAGDAPTPESACLERKNKRRKIKSKRDRLQIDQLLSVSLREEELSRSLQTVDDSLNQARAALQAAYMEVQRLMVVKQQMTAEMSTLRNKRIELLKGMQGGEEEAPHLSVKEEKTDSAAALSPSQPDHSASSPSSSLPSMPVVIKQEPHSPVHVNSEPLENIIHSAHSTTPELPVASAAASHSGNQQPLQERWSDLYEANREHVWENVEAPVECKESLSVVQAVEKAVQATRDTLTPSSDSKFSSRRSSEVGSLADCTASQSFEPSSVPSGLALPAFPTELRNVKRVRKLKKRRVLKKAQGTEHPESSDNEMDGEASRPRWTRARRRPSGGSQISTSTLPAAVEDEEAMALERDREGSEEAPGPTIKREEEDMASLKVSTELMSFDTAEPEESMEVTAACQQPYVDSQVQVPESHKSEPQTVACNEVTSTSDMDICISPPVRPYESDTQMTLTVPKISKTSSDVSSDHGEDAVPTEGAFEGHQEAVNAMQIHDGLLYTCSGDRTIKAFDLVSHKCVTVFEGHSSKVNCLLVSAAPGLHQRLYSGSSDQTIRCYSLKTREFEQQFSLSDRVLCLHSRWKVLFAGLANGTVVTFNLKTNKQTDVFECHGPRGVSCLASSQEGARRILLVGSYDSTISVRDAKSGLLLRTLEGHTKTVLCMKVVNDLVFSGSSDQTVHAHNIHTAELVRVYQGHSHGVTVVAVLGKVMVTACLDKLVRVYELQSHEQLQVYGGHKDMVMCMAVQKSMIYTGCYDGSVQAVKLNLMQNYRCWWHGCSLVFGLTEHLHQHLINDHTTPSVQTLKCRWKNCEEFFCARNSAKKGMLVHMQKHAEEETELEP